MKKNANIVLVVLVIVLSLIVIAMGVYIVANKNEASKTENIEFVNDKINVEELNKIVGKSDFNIIKMESDNKHNFSLDIDGKVNIDFNTQITNISDAKDILSFSTPTDEYILYILTESGDLYKYDVSNVEKGNFTAIKVNEYSNIQKIMTYSTRKANAGGCNYILLIDSNGKYFELTSFCV